MVMTKGSLQEFIVVIIACIGKYFWENVISSQLVCQ
jgi:hypothetical protein